LRINQMIRIPQVRVVDEEGAQLGVMPTPRALAMAQERGYDLVEVAPMAQPPVARFLDFGQYKYELTKREKEAKRKQRSVTFKEVRLKPKIGTGDFDTKVRRAIEFLEDGDRIKVAVQFRGRELTHPEIGRALLDRFTDRIKDHGAVERSPLLEGKSMHITVASTHKPKVHETPAAAGHPPVNGASVAGEAAAAATPVAEAPKAAKPAPAKEQRQATVSASVAGPGQAAEVAPAAEASRAADAPPAPELTPVTAEATPAPEPAPAAATAPAPAATVEPAPAAEATEPPRAAAKQPAAARPAPSTTKPRASTKRTTSPADKRAAAPTGE
jgi:translation initiation factor IF-3